MLTTNPLAAFDITKRWPATRPDAIQLYSYPTKNGVKISIALEELGLDYEPHLVSLSGDNTTPEFLSLNPNNKIPAIIDPKGPDGTPVTLFESGAILIYLAEKTGKLLPKDAAGRAQTIQWVMFQVSGLGPMLGQLGYFVKFAGREIEDPRPRDRYIAEAKRLLNVLEKHLAGREWIMDEFTIADIAIGPWLGAIDFYDIADLVGWADFPNVQTYFARFMARPAVAKGQNIPNPAQ